MPQPSPLAPGDPEEVALAAARQTHRRIGDGLAFLGGVLIWLAAVGLAACADDPVSLEEVRAAAADRTFEVERFGEHPQLAAGEGVELKVVDAICEGNLVGIAVQELWNFY